MCIADFRVCRAWFALIGLGLGLLCFLVLGCCTLLFFAWLFDDSECVWIVCLLRWFVLSCDAFMGLDGTGLYCVGFYCGFSL